MGSVSGWMRGSGSGSGPGLGFLSGSVPVSEPDSVSVDQAYFFAVLAATHANGISGKLSF